MEAANNLRTSQQQLDMDGVMVGVSRQALEEVLESHAELVTAAKFALEQAEGCFFNHYPGDDPYTAAEPEHIAMLRAAISRASR